MGGLDFRTCPSDASPALLVAALGGSHDIRGGTGHRSPRTRWTGALRASVHERRNPIGEPPRENTSSVFEGWVSGLGRDRFGSGWNMPAERDDFESETEATSSIGHGLIGRRLVGWTSACLTDRRHAGSGHPGRGKGLHQSPWMGVRLRSRSSPGDQVALKTRGDAVEGQLPFRGHRRPRALALGSCPCPGLRPWQGGADRIPWSGKGSESWGTRTLYRSGFCSPHQWVSSCRTGEAGAHDARREVV